MHHRVQVKPLKLLCGQSHRGRNLRQPRHGAIFELLSLGLVEVVLSVCLIDCHVAGVGLKLINYTSVQVWIDSSRLRRSESSIYTCIA